MECNDYFKRLALENSPAHQPLWSGLQKLLVIYETEDQSNVVLKNCEETIN